MYGNYMIHEPFLLAVSLITLTTIDLLRRCKEKFIIHGFSDSISVCKAHGC